MPFSSVSHVTSPRAPSGTGALGPDPRHSSPRPAVHPEAWGGQVPSSPPGKAPGTRTEAAAQVHANRLAVRARVP